jgi:hypothetical protein
MAVSAFRWNSRRRSSSAVDAAGPVGVALPVLDNSHDVTGVGSVYESSVAVADGHVAGVVEEDQVAGLELAQWHTRERGHLLFAGTWEDFAAGLEVGMLHQRGAVEADGVRTLGCW